MPPPALATIGVTPTYGNLFDRFVGGTIRWATATRSDYGSVHWINARVNHAVLFVGDVPGHSKPQLIQAQPGGASLADWDSYGPAMIWLDKLAPCPNLTDIQRHDIAAAGLAMQGIGYGYADLLAIALAQQRLHSLVDVKKALAEQPWWVRQIENQHRLICSQLCDQAYLIAGVHLFEDWLPGLVSPANLAALAVG